MGDSNFDGSVVKSTIDFVEGKEKAKTAVKRALKYERDNECSNECHFQKYETHGRGCWEPGSDVPMQPYYIGAIKQSPLTEVLMDSNNHTKLSLADWDSVYKGLERLEQQPDKYSEEWIKQQVNDANQTLAGTLDRVELSSDDHQMIENTVESNNALEFWSDYVAPQVKYREKAKKSILIMLASPEDKYGNKGRINTFFYGEPGTGKSLFKSFLKSEFNAKTIDGPRVSKADLTYNKAEDKLGKLPQAHKGILAIEEADEMGEDELGATLTSLGETGRIEIRDMEIPAQARGLMLSNFESEREIITNWSPESLNRFDFTIKFEKMDSQQKSQTLDWHYEHFRKPNPQEYDDLLQKYIKKVRGYEPEIRDSEKIKEYKEEKVDMIDNVREGISIMNVAWTIARLNLENVKLKYYKQAFDLVVN